MENITNDKVTDFINDYYRPLDTYIGDLRKRCEDGGIPIILKETEIFFNTFLKMLSPKRMLEIGTAYGYSSIFFAKAVPGLFVTTIEKDQKMADAAHADIDEAGLSDKIRVYEGDALEILDALRYPGCDSANDCGFDFVFIDASKSRYREFFNGAVKLCNYGAVIVCDNVLLKASVTDSRYDFRKRRHSTNIRKMREFLDYVHSLDGIDVSLLSCGDGLLIAKLVGDGK